MARIPYLEKKDVSEEVQGIYEKMEHNFGIVPNIFKAMAHKPGILKGLLALEEARYSEGKLDPRLRELAYLKASKVNGCRY